MIARRSDGCPKRFGGDVTDQDSETRGKGAGDTATTNVVRFPRPWYGSVDELVPISSQPRRETPQLTVLPHASDFWGGSLEVEVQLETDAEADTSPNPAPPPIRGHAPATTAGGCSPQTQRATVSQRKTRTRPALRARGSAVAVLLLVGCLAAAATAAALGVGSPARHMRAANAANAANGHGTVQRDTTQRREGQDHRHTLSVTPATAPSIAVRPVRPRRRQGRRSRGRNRLPTRATGWSHTPSHTHTSSVAAAPVTATPPSTSLGGDGGSSSSTAGSNSSSANPPQTPPGCAPSVTNGGACSL